MVRPVRPTRRPDAGRLVHLPEDEDGVAEDAGLLHLVPEVVPFAGPLAHSGEDGNALVDGANVTYELLDDDRLAHSGSAVCADLAALGEWGD